MPASLSYPGVYIEELPSAVRTITGVPTSITAFVGRAWKGAVNEPVKINSYADYERNFGGLWRDSTLSYAVQQFFMNGGSQALVVRVTAGSGAKSPAPSEVDLTSGTKLVAASDGTWGRNLVVTVEPKEKTKDPSDPKLFNLIIFDDPQKKDDVARRGGSGVRETFLNVSTDTNSARYIKRVLEQQSSLVRAQTVGTNAPTAVADKQFDKTKGHDGDVISDTAVVGTDLGKTGIYALKKADIFNLLCIPPLTPGASGTDVALSTWTAAAQLCKEQRAFLVVDAPGNWTVSTVNSASPKLSDFSAIQRDYAALYFPRIRLADPLQDNNLEDYAPCGVVAGIMSRIDSERGIWKAPAGIEASLRGVMGLSINGTPAMLTDKENGDLNPIGINCLRGFPNIGTVVWGARTLEGSDILASQWKYVPVRRLALYVEESLFRGTQWVVFEPNDEPLWAQIRLNLNAFMHGLFRQGAFQGVTPREAYLVKCDRETTTQDDINRGVVNILVGFAPLKPAEFVVIKIQQLAGQTQT